MVRERGGRRTDWNGPEARARSREWTKCAKALRLPWTTAAGRNTEAHDRRAHHHESSYHRIFS